MDDIADAAAAQPDLQTSEGVNEGSRKSAAEGGPANDGVRGGGRPTAPIPDRDLTRFDRDGQVVVPPWVDSDPGAPSLEQSVEEQRATW